MNVLLVTVFGVCLFSVYCVQLVCLLLNSFLSLFTEGVLCVR